MEIGGEPQKKEVAKEIDEPCPGECIDSGARFSSISGEVMVQHCWDNEDSRYYAAPSTVLCVGDHILTGEDSNAVVTFSDLSTLMVKPEAEIVIAAPPAKATKLEIIYGRLKMNVQKVLSGDTLEVKSNLATVGIKGTTIVCEVTESSSTLKVLEGTAGFTAKATGEKILVSAGKMATATKSGLAQLRAFDVAAEKASWEKLARNNPQADQALLGNVWRVTEYGGWTATWTRRGNSSVFDGVWFNGSQKVTGMLTMAVQGRVVRIQSRQQTNGYDVDYEGTLSRDGRSIQGTLKVMGSGGIYDWKATIASELIVTLGTIGIGDLFSARRLAVGESDLDQHDLRITRRAHGRPPGLRPAGNKKMSPVDVLISPAQVIFQPGDPVDGEQLPVVGMGRKLDINGVAQGLGKFSGAMVHEDERQIPRGSPQYFVQRPFAPPAQVASPRQTKGAIDDDEAIVQDRDPGQGEKTAAVGHPVVFMVPQRGINPVFCPELPE
jgi:hypothetical protein